MDLPPRLEGIRQVVEDLVKAIGLPCEVVLHDLRDPSRAIVAIAGGITGRDVGGPTTDLVLRQLRSQQLDRNLIAYASKTSKGTPLRSSTIFVRDESGAVIGCLCLNIDLTYWNLLQALVGKLCDTSPGAEPADAVSETFDTNVAEVVKMAVAHALDSVGQPVARMQKQEKLQVVRILDQDGVFMIRGTVEFVAEALGVSRPTVYNYLAELRNSERFE